MYKLLYIILFLFAAAGAQAQQLPERSLVRKGNRQYNKGNYEQSIGRYEQALQAAPGQFEAIYNLGNALYKAERFDRAEQTMQQAAADSLRADTERAEAFYNLGNAQFKQQKYQEALESYKQSLRLNPSDMEAKYNYAYTKRLLDQNKNGGGGGGNDQKDQDKDQDKDQNKDQNQNGQGQQTPDQKGDQKDQKGDPKDQQDDQKQDPQDGKGDKGDKGDQQGQPTPSGISPQEQQQMLDAIQAQEDKTQEKLKEKQGVVVRGKKNW
ncbi:tetratricopeptide repeat protein [Alistipes sp.]|uniref:tetratricopeptide repeat protein n=1 Tax=Alistipes sp. TaxID=1872444 RepID=UPI003AEFCACD